ncbi:MAG TPA: radical SAM protein [Anaeromyxobacter sp.]|nr:radical SAM protein [Anaeromyxobacter sp.]
MHAALRHIPALLLRDRPAQLTFFVTRRCNATCPFCFYADERDRRGGAPELSLDEIRRVARSMGPLLWVLFSGGEPYLREDLAAIAQAFHDASGAGFLTVPTNGLLPHVVAETTEEILRRCPRSVVVVKVSIDGVGGDHDALRRTPGGFEKALRSVERLAALARAQPRLELGVNTVLCRENEERIDAVVDLVAALDGVRAHTLTVARGDGSPGAFADVDLDLYRRATARLEARWRGRHHRFAGGGLKAAQDRVQRRLVRATLAERRRLVPCRAGRRSLVLSECGDVSACEGRRREPLGNVREAGYDVGAVLRSARAARVLADVARGGCHCAHECNMLVNVLLDARTYPRLLREWTRPRPGGSSTEAAADALAPGAADGARRERRQFA